VKPRLCAKVGQALTIGDARRLKPVECCSDVRQGASGMAPPQADSAMLAPIIAHPAKGRSLCNMPVTALFSMRSD
jgi:hypothetical protein